MGNKYVADYKRMRVFMASAGTAGDILYNTTGSALPGANAGQFWGVLDETQVAGSYAVCDTEGVFEMSKGDGTAVKIEQGQSLWGSGASAVATAVVSTGSIIGVAWAQSSSDTSTVAVKIDMYHPNHG